MNRTRIEWVVNGDGRQGFTWNPVTGCLHGCGYCYARSITKRFDKPGYFSPVFHQDRLNPKFPGKPSTIFVCSMSDLFGDWVPDSWIFRVLDIVKQCSQHTFLFLTKNPSRYQGFEFPNNCWLGATTDTANRASAFTDNLTFKKSTNKTFISAEPLLGDIADYVDYGAVDWIIIGGLNRNGKPVRQYKEGPGLRWVIYLIRRARRHKVPVFVKNGLSGLCPELKNCRDLPYLAKKEVCVCEE